MPDSTQKAPHANTRGHSRVRRFLRICVYAAVTALLLLALLPLGMRLGAQYWLNKHPGVKAEIGNIDLNLFNATFVLEDLSIEYEGMPHARIERLALGAQYLPLWNKHALIDYIDLKGAHLILEQLEAESAQEGRMLRIGGLLLPQGSPEEQKRKTEDAAETASAWGFGWNSISIEDTKIVWRQPDWNAKLNIEHAHYNDVASWEPKAQSELQMQVHLNGAPVKLTAQTRPFARERSASGHIKIDDFALAKLTPILASAGIHDLKGRFSCDLEHEVSVADTNDVNIGWDGTLSLKQGELSTPQVHVADAELRWEGKGNISSRSGGDETRLDLDSTLQVPVLDLETLENGMALQQQGLSWKGRTSTVLQQGKNPQVEVLGAFETADLSVVDKSRARMLTSWQGMKGSGISFNGEELNLEELSLKELVALRPSTNPAETEPPLVRCDAISLANLHFNLEPESGSTAVGIEALTLTGLGVELIRYASGHTNIDQWSSPGATVPETAQSSATDEKANTQAQSGDGGVDSSSEPALNWRLDNLQIAGDSFIHFTDTSTRPDVDLKLGELNLSLQHLDSQAPLTRNPFKLNATLGRFSTLETHGNISVLAPEPQGNLELKLHGFQLYNIEAYIEEIIGARIERGELDLDAEASIQNNVLKLDSEAKLRAFTLGAMTPEQQERVSSNLGMPLSLALALLRDNNGDIHLDIPVSGDLSSPDVAIAPVVRKALFGAVQETVKLALKPLGILTGAGKLIGIGGDLKLPPVEFAPTQADLEDPGTTLKPLGDLLGKRPQLRVILSAPLSSADVAAIQAQVKKQTPEEKTKDSKKTGETAEQGLTQKQLQTLALPLLEKRLHGIKQWLLDNAGVQSKQVLLTQPRLDPVEGPPRVEMHF